VVLVVTVTDVLCFTFSSPLSHCHRCCHGRSHAFSRLDTWPSAWASSRSCWKARPCPALPFSREAAAALALFLLCSVATQPTCAGQIHRRHAISAHSILLLAMLRLCASSETARVIPLHWSCPRAVFFLATGRACRRGHLVVAVRL
jgi:hypothetical protein